MNDSFFFMAKWVILFVMSLRGIDHLGARHMDHIISALEVTIAIHYV